MEINRNLRCVAGIGFGVANFFGCSQGRDYSGRYEIGDRTVQIFTAKSTLTTKMIVNDEGNVFTSYRVYESDKKNPRQFERMMVDDGEKTYIVERNNALTGWGREVVEFGVNETEELCDFIDNQFGIGKR